MHLAFVLCLGGRKEHGLGMYRRLLVEGKDNAALHRQYGITLELIGRDREAENAYREVVRLQPTNPRAHLSLGYALFEQGRYREAEDTLLEAVRLDGGDAEAHTFLGMTLYEQGRYREAEMAYRQAIGLDLVYPYAHYNLGIELARQLRYPEAEAAFRKAVRLGPHIPAAHHNLGSALGRQGRYREAEAEFREAIRLYPDYLEAHYNLGLALRNQGRFAEAVDSFRRGQSLAGKIPDGPSPFAEEIRYCERGLELDRRLPAVLAGQEQPASPTEALEFSWLCQQYKRLPVAAARLAAAAFAAQPGLANDLRIPHRYNAACAAALGAAGQGEDAAKLDGQERANLRRQALDWLRADLAGWTSVLDKKSPLGRTQVQQKLQHWQQDPDLAGVRGEKALSRLPEAERRAWSQLWADVAELLKRAREKPVQPLSNNQPEAGRGSCCHEGFLPVKPLFQYTLVHDLVKRLRWDAGFPATRGARPSI
jgi:Flp pilus assembly protein TadD